MVSDLTSSRLRSSRRILQNKKKALEARVGDADKKVQELNTKVEKVRVDCSFFFYKFYIVLFIFYHSKMVPMIFSQLCTLAV